MSATLKKARKHTVHISESRQKHDSYRKAMQFKQDHVSKRTVATRKPRATTTLCEIVARYEDIDIDNAMYTLSKIAAK